MTRLRLPKFIFVYEKYAIHKNQSGVLKFSEDHMNIFQQLCVEMTPIYEPEKLG